MPKIPKEVLEHLKKTQESHKLQKISIPDGAESYWLIYDVEPTKSAETRAKNDGREPNILDGIAVKMACVGYVDKKTNKLIQCIDYSDPLNIKFSCDIKDENTGEVQYMTGLTYNEYLTVQRLTSKFSPYGGYSAPTTEKACALLYDASFSRQYGRENFELFTVILNTGIVKDLRWDTIGAEDTNEEKIYPIIPAYRYVDFRYDYKDLVKGKPVEGATKKPNVNLKIWNREEANDELKKVPTKWIPESIANKIHNAIVEREIAKTLIKNPLNEGLPSKAPF